MAFCPYLIYANITYTSERIVATQTIIPF